MSSIRRYEVATDTVVFPVATFRLGKETLCWKNGSNASASTVIAAPTETNRLTAAQHVTKDILRDY